MDDGEVVNGDMYAGDGVYSAFFKPGKEGEFTLSVHVRGEYKDISFEQHKDLEGFRAVPAGKVIFSLPDISEIILNPGKVNIVEIQADSQSSRTERLEFSLADSDEITMQPYAAYLINNRINVLELEINVPENTPVGQKGQLVFKVGSMNYDTILSHDTITIDYVIEPAKTSPVLPIVLGGLALAAAGFLIIKIIRKMIIKMASYVKGSLVYWKGSDIDKKEQINLSRFRSERVRLCTLPGEKVRQIADLGEAVDLVFYTESSGKGVSYFVSGGIDNILYTADNVPHKILKLENGLIFRVNSLYFQYNNPKVEAQSGPGVNVLEKYGIDL